MMKKHPFIDHIEIIYEGDSNELESIALIKTNLELNPRHPNHDDEKVNSLIDHCMSLARGDFPLASKIRIESS